MWSRVAAASCLLGQQVHATLVELRLAYRPGVQRVGGVGKMGSVARAPLAGIFMSALCCPNCRSRTSKFYGFFIHPDGAANVVALSVSCAGGWGSDMARNVDMPLERPRRGLNEYLIHGRVTGVCKVVMPCKLAACRRVFLICGGARPVAATAASIHGPRRMTIRGLPFHDGSAKTMARSLPTGPLHSRAFTESRFRSDPGAHDARVDPCRQRISLLQTLTLQDDRVRDVALVGVVRPGALHGVAAIGHHHVRRSTLT